MRIASCYRDLDVQHNRGSPDGTGAQLVNGLIETKLSQFADNRAADSPAG
jgi:hypothetical protein